MHVHVQLWLFATLWIVATRLLCPWDFPSKNTRIGLPFPIPRDLSDPGINCVSCIYRKIFFTTVPPGKSYNTMRWVLLLRLRYRALSNLPKVKQLVCSGTGMQIDSRTPTPKLFVITLILQSLCQYSTSTCNLS